MLVANARGKTGTATEADSPVSTVAVDTSGAVDTVYEGFRQSHSQQVGSVNNLMVATSTDGGATFGTPVNLNTFSKQTFTAANGMTYTAGFSTPHMAAGDGVAYVVTSASYPTAAHGPTLQPFIGTSTDQGKTWNMQPVLPKGSSQPVMAWSPMGGPKGTAYVVFQYKLNQTQGNTDIYFQKSNDGDQTWSTAARLNDDDPNNNTYHLLPNISVAPNGRVDVAWSDFLNAQAFADDVYYTYSTDNGATWAPNIRATDQLVNLNLGLNNNSDVRQPPGIGSSNDDTVIGWTDTRLGNDTDQTQDVFASVVQFKTIASGGSSTVKYFAAGAVGLVIAGVIVFLIAMGRRKRAEGPPPATQEAREPVGVS